MSEQVNSTPNVLLAVSGADFELQLVRIACERAKQRKGKVYVVHVLEVPRTLPIDADMSEESRKADAILSRIEDAAREASCSIEAEMIQARDVGQTLVDESKDRRAGLLLMGMQRREKYGKFYLGSTIPHVLAHARCRVWIVREEMEEQPQSGGKESSEQVAPMPAHPKA